MHTRSRYFLVGCFKSFDLVLFLGSFIAAAFPSLKQVGATSVTDFLSMRLSVRNFVLFSALFLLWYSLFSVFGLYESKRLSGQGTEAFDILKATTTGTLILVVVGAFLKLSVIHPLFVTVFWMTNTGAVVLSRRVARFVLVQTRRRGRNLRHILVVGTNSRAVKFAMSLGAQPGLGYRLLGFVDQEWPGIEEFHKMGYTCVCDLKGLQSFIRHGVVDEVAIALPIKSLYPEISRIVAVCQEQGLATHVLSTLFDYKVLPARAGALDHDSLITLHAGAMQGWALLAKRAFDIGISGLCLVLSTPIFVTTAILIKLTSHGPVFFVQKRVGLNKRVIYVYKFRTMVPDAESKQAALEHLNEARGPVFKIKNDPRITPLGKFLRRTSIDELPQLINVLKGDMSLVGPRPLPLRDYEGFNDDWQRRRFSIRPGITCLWQINGRSSVPFERWMELDLEYVDRWSIWLDFQILLRTIPAVLKGSGAA